MTDQPQKKVLVVEDDQYLRDLYVEILEAEKYVVDHAAEGLEAYQKMFQGGYDLVLLDIMLPQMDGLKILSKLKNETPPVKPNSKIVILSNLGQESAITQTLGLGASGYMIKSEHTPDQVIAKVKGYLAEP
jgi:DNA-binding response OmpR family regulator